MTTKFNIENEMTLESFVSTPQAIFQSVAKNHQPMIVTEGDDSVLLISLDDCADLFMDETEYLLSNHQNKKDLLENIKRSQDKKNLITVEI